MVQANDDLSLDELDGGQLRRKLEDAIRENRELRKENHGHRVKDTLAAGSEFGLVKPEDLEEVPLDKIEERAKELQKQRVDTQDLLLREALKTKGLSDEQVEEFVKSQAPPATEDGEQRARDERAAQARRIAGATAGTSDNDGLTGRAAIRAHFVKS